MFSFSQNLSIKIDSIELIYLPRTLTAPISYTKTTFLSIKSDWIKRKIISDTSVLSNFSDCLNLSNLNVSYDPHKEIDVRLVIMIYCEGKKELDVLVDNRYRYTFLGITHKPEWSFKTWIENQIDW